MPTQTLTVEVPGAVTSGAVAEKIDIPQNGSIDKVILTAGTAGSAISTVDVLVNGVSLYAQPVGTLQGVDSTGQNTATPGITATDARIVVKVDGTVEEGVLRGAVLIIDSEQLLVVGNEAGSNEQSGGTGTIQGGPIDTTGITLDLSVQRGYNGTTAAAHTHGAVVTSEKAFLPASATNSGSIPGIGATATVNAGDVVTFAVTPGAGLADLTIELELTVN
jgi:hypothetical protein